MNYGNRQHAQATQENGPEERERLRDKEWKRKEIKSKQKGKKTRNKAQKQSTTKKKQHGISYMIKLTESFLVRGIVLLSRALLYFLNLPPLPPPEALPG